ncbi:hypothetical protein JCM10914A_40400 [Paenibacillus sp. JCM 10914]|uniref:hypothetical protein n=1 Tax=Paenibacillus sp. JCM 10914 TaxID=1236974 RepID=UPI0003CCA71D|nr:hypothetical protein [Paenibacillus sp. JCM 10914]GAE05252.1 hypothetical protein JCM10914_1347 [Paenibacillus sp. JCM 10914]
MTTYSNQQQILFQCDHQIAHHMKKHRENAHAALKNAMNRKVRIQTIDDEVVEGVIFNIDAKNVYILVEQANRGFYPGFPPYGYGPNPNVVLPLALFNLLAVSLLW